MSVKLYREIQSFQDGDSSAAWFLVQKFTPLLKHYAYLACKEDAFEDLQCYFLSLLKALSLDKLSSYEDGVIISYINKSIRNAYIAIAKSKMKNSVVDYIEDLPTPATEELNKRASHVDHYEKLLQRDMQSFLTAAEYKVIYALYFKQQTVTEIAIQTHKSRQAINQTKISALKKLRKAWQ